MSNKAFRLLLVLAVVLAALAAPTVLAQDDLIVPIGDQPEIYTWDGLQEFADAYDLTGQEIEIFGPWLAPTDAVFESVIDYFEWATGATVVYSGSDDAEQIIVTRVNGNDAPDIYVFPQPGAAGDFAAQGQLVPLGDETGQWIEDNYGSGADWRAFSTLLDQNGEEQMFLFPFKQDLKSLVWYVPDNFADAGYEVPGTMEDLIALSEQMVADGNTPWCIGIESGGATGWPATDWIEDILLRTQPPEVYDQWVTNEIPFTDERILGAIETFGTFVFSEGWVNGGSESIVTTSFRDAPAGLFTVPAECFMHRQASFISDNFPEDAELGVDVDAFYFPSFESEDLGNPVLGAGTLMGIFNESETASAFIEFLKLPIAHEIWMAQGGIITAHQGVNLDAYADNLLRSQGEILQSGTTFRFDGSDLMPGAIGAGAFWTGMVEYVNGVSAEEVGQLVQDAWDELE